MMKKKKSGLAAGLLLLAALMAGCGSSKYNSAGSTDAGYGAANNSFAAADTASLTEMADMNFYDEAAAAEEYYEYEEAGAGSNAEILEENSQSSERKLIKTVDLQAETENYDVLITNLENQIVSLGGYIEYQSQYNGSSYAGYDETRNAYMQIRIPAQRLSEFVVKIGEESNITSKEERVEDVTLQYVDLESHRNALSIEQERLLELLERAETIEDIIALEQRLSDVRYQLESMESQIRTLINQVDYSTVNLSIQEVRRLTPVEEKSVWDKMKNGFVKSIYRIGDDIEYEMIRFVINIPYFIIWIVIIIVIILILRAIAKRRKIKLSDVKEKVFSYLKDFWLHRKYRKAAKRKKEMAEYKEALAQEKMAEKEITEAIAESEEKTEQKEKEETK